jgi:hypothetical protein
VNRPALSVGVALLTLALAGCGGSDKKKDARTVTGAGYAFRLPARWVNASSIAKPPVDRLALGSTVGGFRTNVNVIREPRPPGLDLGRAAIAGQRAVERAVHATSDAPPASLRLGGEPAYTSVYRFTQKGRHLREQQVQAFHGAGVFTVTLTADARGFAAGQSAYRALLASWHWR